MSRNIYAMAIDHIILIERLRCVINSIFDFIPCLILLSSNIYRRNRLIKHIVNFFWFEHKKIGVNESWSHLVHNDNNCLILQAWSSSKNTFKLITIIIIIIIIMENIKKMKTNHDNHSNKKNCWWLTSRTNFLLLLWSSFCRRRVGWILNDDDHAGS